VDEEEEDVEVGILFVSQRAIQHYNREYRGIDAPTDVLSFAMREGDTGKWEGKSSLLGDLVISLEKVYEEAPLFQRGPREQLLFVLIHGLLHLLGYDHESSRNEAARMKRRETQLLKKIL